MFEFTYLLDMTAHAPVYDAEMRKSFGLGFHPNPMGYYAYALMVGNYIDYIIRSNPQEFATIPFVGTLLKTKITNRIRLLQVQIYLNLYILIVSLLQLILNI